tara:strand:+ start:1287 stop:1643 length:357 start_codon:yes stop_codon:yes gene_type:complete
MGLDVGFYRNKEEIFYLRNHRDFLTLFDEDIGGRVNDIYNDFYVTLETIDLVDAMLAELFIDCKIPASSALTEVSDRIHEMDARDEDLKDLLCYYPAIIRMLRADITKHGPLICGWSA